MKIVNNYIFPQRLQNGPDSFWVLVGVKQLSDGTYVMTDRKGCMSIIDQSEFNILDGNWPWYKKYLRG